MSNTVLGNKQEYTFYQDYHEVEIDDDEWIDMEGELVDEAHPRRVQGENRDNTL